MQLAQLLDRAKEVTGSDAATATAIGVKHAHRMSEWRHGKVACPLGVQVKLCRIARLSTSEAWHHMEEAAGLGKLAASIAGFGVAFATFTAIAFAQPAQAHGLTPCSDRDNV